MTWHGYSVSANVSLLFSELPYLDRFAAAAAAGFTRVETWWPFDTPDPTPEQVDALLAALDAAGLELTGLNFYAGDMPGGERGVACLADREQEAISAGRALRRIAERTGCRGFNLLYGAVPEGLMQADVQPAAVASYRRAAELVADLDGIVLVEPLARGLNGAYPLETAQDALDLIDEVGAPNVRLLLDTFHLGSNGVDMLALIAESCDRIGHVQLADSPGRGEPGSGELDLTAIGEALRARGYAGTVAAEYRPTRETPLTLGWLSPGEAPPHRA